MRELEREPRQDIPLPRRLAIVGAGRLGRALSSTLTAAGVAVVGPLGREADLARADAVMLCVPDGEIAAAAASLPGGLVVGHPSGATALEVLAPHERFVLHPLMTVAFTGAELGGAGVTIAGSTPRALAYARSLADALRMQAVELADEDRAVYHAAASVASNFLLTLEDAAEQLSALAGVRREMLVPLVRATVENWAAHGAAEVLTGPIARGDERTVAAHREAIGARAPELLDLYDVLAAHTRALAAQTVPA
ncbi:MAG: DUF2520 domain-containing protein [Solirubrobacterales bacterium]|nr:DUF2520 domain-containing protein [Solirubrobacterales bacterium]